MQNKGQFLFSMYTLNPHNEIGKSTKPTFLTQQKYAADYGVNFVTLGVPVAWNEKILEIFQKKYYEPLFDALVKNNPNVRIIPRVGVDPPKWWLDKNPDSEMRNYDGQPTTRISNDLVRTVQRFVAVSSEKYQKDADDALRMTIKHLESKYGKYIAGYHPAGQHTGEWVYPGCFSDIPNGYDKCTVKSFRKWLTEKYKNDAALQKAWSN